MKTKPSISRWLLSFSLIAAPAWAANITVAPSGGDYTTIQDAVTAANPGDTITVATGTYALPATVTLNKPDLTIQAAPSETPLVTADISTGSSVFYIGTTGVTIQGLHIQKTDKSGPQALVQIGASDTTIANCEFSGEFVIGDGEVSRAMVINAGAFSGLSITNNVIHGLRQPAYISGTHTGTISGNYVYGTKGWVVEGGNLTFTGNTWGSGANANVLDIAILSLAPSGFYTDLPALSAANNGAAVEDQRSSPSLLTTVYVNSAVATTGNGNATSPFKTIAEGVSRVMAGGAVNVAVGGYSEDVTLNKRVNLIGSGSGADPASSTILQKGVSTDSKIGIIQVAASGISDVDAVSVRNMRVSANGKAGISIGRFTEATATVVSHLTLDNVHVIGTNVTPSTEQERGLYVDLTSTLEHLTVKDCAFDNLTYGWYIQKQVSAESSNVRFVDVRNTTFNHNNHKGIYTEKLSDAVFTGCTIDDNGYDASLLPSYFQPWSAGVDLNLKAGSYSNVSLVDCIITDNAKGGVKEGVGITFKARDDGGTYGPFPAGLTGVLIRGCTITGNERGIRLGEPGKNNATPVNVVIEQSSVYGNLKSYPGTDGSPYGDLVNQTAVTADATHNYWGASQPNFGSISYGSVSYLPYYTDAALTQLFYPVRNITRNTGSMTIQPEIDAALAGDVIEISAGTYNGAITVNKDIDLVGAGSASTVINSSGTVVAIPAAGSGASISGIRATGGARGFNLTGVSGVILDGVSSDGNTSFGLNFDGASSNITLRNSSFSNNTSSGIKVSSTSRVSGLLVDACAVNGNTNGLYAGDGNAAFYQAGAQLQGLTINHGSSFSNNAGKGIYIESMNNGLFDGISVVGSGTGITGGTAGGIDINLKFANYSDLTIRNSLVSGCGRNYSFGGGILVKARNDGSYAGNPATLGGTVLLEGLRVENNGGLPYGAGIRIGDSIPNTSPSNVQIHGCAFTGNSKYAVLNVLGSGTVNATGNYWASPTGPIGLVTNGVGGAVNCSPWYNVSDASTPPVLSDMRSGIISDLVITTPQTYGDLYVAPGTTVTVAPEGSLAADKVELAEDAEITVNGGELDLGQGSVISGTFTIFNSFGSWDINGDTTFNIGQSLALISDIHIAAGKTVTVSGGGELILDGCVIDSQTPGTPYNLTAATDGFLTLARSVVTDANIDINTTLTGNLRSRIYDSSFITSDIEAAAAAKVYHNLFDGTTDAAKNTDATTAFNAIDGWANVTDAGLLQNKFTLDFEAPAAIGRTLDAAGNLFVQPADAVVVKMDVSALGTNTITAAEALLGYNSGMLALASSPTRVTPLGDWEVIAETAPAPSGLGIVDSALGLQLNAGEEGISAASQIAKVNFTAGNPGLTLGFFRVQTDGLFNPDGTLVKDTRLTKSSGGMPSLLEAFTANTGELIIDNQLPAIATTGQTGTQVQPTNGTVNVLDPAKYVIRNGTPVVLTFTGTDAGLAGLDAADAINDLELSATNGTTVLSDWTVSATESSGVVTYTVTLNVPAAATNGTYAVTATVIDRSGNLSPVASLGSFQIANEALATVELQGYGGGSRSVVFTATNGAGAVLTTWTKSVVFTGAVGAVPLEAVPAGTAAISAKAAWNLRSKKTATFSPEGVAAVSLTGADLLPAGDINGDNVVNTLDYSILRFNWLTTNAVADLTGDGRVNVGDYGLLRDNFYTIGDSQ